MIVPKSHFVEIPWKVFFGDHMEFGETFLGIAPEAFQTLNINFARGKSFPMVNAPMAVSAEHQGVITPEFIGVNDGTASYHFHGLSQQAFRSDVFTTVAFTFPCLSRIPKTGSFPAAPLPRLPLRLPPRSKDFMEINRKSLSATIKALRMRLRTRKTV